MTEQIIDARPLAKSCRLHSEFPHAGALHRVTRASIKVRDLPAELALILRAHGCAPWLDDPEEDLPLPGEVVIVADAASTVGYGYAPQPTIPLAEFVGAIRNEPTPAERREQTRLAAEAETRRQAERKAQEDRKLAEWRKAQEDRAEAERMKNPQYRTRKLEERLAALERGAS